MLFLYIFCVDINFFKGVYLSVKNKLVMLVKKEINQRFKCGLNSKNISDNVLSNNLFNVGKNLKLIIKHKYSFCNVIADEDIQNEIIKDKFLGFIDINYIILDFLCVVGPWLLVISIIDFVKMWKSSIKENFLNLESNHMMFKHRIISKLYNYNHKHVCKKKFYTRIFDNKNKISDFYFNHGEHYTVAFVYKDKNLGYFFISLNFTINFYYKKMAEAGILHESKFVHVYPKCDIKELKIVEDIKNLTNYLKNIKIIENYSKKVINNKSVNEEVQKDLKLELKNEYGYKDLVNLTLTTTNNKDFNIALIDVVKDVEKLNMDKNQEFRLSYYNKEIVDKDYEKYMEQQKKDKNNDK